MHFKFALLLASVAIRLVAGAPTATLDSVTLLKNGESALALNAQWANFTAADPCTGPQMACVENSIATCIDRKWEVSAGRCADGQKCFALPQTRKEGISILCTSEKNALSVIDSSGATADDSSSQDSVVTVTITVAPGATTLPVETRTISPSDAARILSSIAATQTALPTADTTQTRTLSPADASNALSSIAAAGEPTAAPTTTMCNMAHTTNTITLAAAQPTTFDY